MLGRNFKEWALENDPRPLPVELHSSSNNPDPFSFSGLPRADPNSSLLSLGTMAWVLSAPHPSTLLVKVLPLNPWEGSKLHMSLRPVVYAGLSSDGVEQGVA